MKKTILLTGLLSAALHVQAQFSTFPTDEAVWANVIYSGWSNNYSTIYKVAVHGDTTMGGKAYKKVFTADGPIFDINFAQYLGGLRQEIGFPGPKIWMRWAGENDEQLLYDYTVGAGDTVTIFPYQSGPTLAFQKVVQELTLAPGTPYPALRFSTINGDEYWLSGIGSNRGLLHPLLETFDATFYLAFTCQHGALYFENNAMLGMENYPAFLTYLQSLYGGVNNPCAGDNFAPINTSTHEAKTSRAWSAFPNPVLDAVELRCLHPLSETAECRVFSSDGRLLKRTALPPGTASARLDLSGLPAGLLLVRISDGQAVCQLRLLKSER